jgi:hypothetical protein
LQIAWTNFKTHSRKMKGNKAEDEETGKVKWSKETSWLYRRLSAGRKEISIFFMTQRNYILFRMKRAKIINHNENFMPASGWKSLRESVYVRYINIFYMFFFQYNFFWLCVAKHILQDCSFLLMWSILKRLLLILFRYTY